jgi:hypothetical protein
MQTSHRRSVVANVKEVLRSRPFFIAAPWARSPLENRRWFDAMRIYGISQSSGVERRLRIEQGGEGLVLTISDHVGNVERDRIMVQPDSLMATVMDRAPGGVTIEGRSPPHGAKKLLDVEIRRNEVLLRVRAELEGGWDVAVGLDDFQDALEKAIG